MIYMLLYICYDIYAMIYKILMYSIIGSNEIL